MYSTIGVFVPMIMEEIEEVGNRVYRFVLVLKNETELGRQVSFDELASGDQHACWDTLADERINSAQ